VLRLCCDQRPAGNGQALVIGVADTSIPHVAEEVERIGHLLGDATLFTGSQATLDRLRAHAPAQGVIHIASHALFRADNPLFSALRLADGWLNINDIYQLQLNARLVTLSGCETGVGLVSRGDELIGLSRAFFYAGAPALVVSRLANATLLRGASGRLQRGRVVTPGSTPPHGPLSAPLLLGLFHRQRRRARRTPQLNH
jgi:hypothetical protein